MVESSEGIQIGPCHAASRTAGSVEGATTAGGLAAGEAAFTPGEVAGLRQVFGKSVAGAGETLAKIATGVEVTLPASVTTDTLMRYREVAQRAISEGIDRLGVQAMRIEIIDKILGN